MLLKTRDDNKHFRQSGKDIDYGKPTMSRTSIEDAWEDDEDGFHSDDDNSEFDSDEEDTDAEEPTIPCPYCRRQIHEDAQRCPYCENYISADDAPVADRKPLWFVAA